MPESVDLYHHGDNGYDRDVYQQFRLETWHDHGYGLHDGVAGRGDGHRASAKRSNPAADLRRMVRAHLADRYRGPADVDLTLQNWDRVGRGVPCLANLIPSGHYLMEDFYYSGGLPALLRELGDFLHKDRPTVNGRTLWEKVMEAKNNNPEVISRG